MKRTVEPDPGKGQQKKPVQRDGPEDHSVVFDSALAGALRHAQNPPTRMVVAMMGMVVAEDGRAHDRSVAMNGRLVKRGQLRLERLVNKFTRPAGPCGHRPSAPVIQLHNFRTGSGGLSTCGFSVLQ